MGLIFYNIFLWVFRLAVWIASLFSPKARLWVKGRRNVYKRIRESVSGHPNVIWVHCASLGEFEQGRPLIEALRSRYQRYRILLTFFSPSGYEVQKNYGGVDWVEYMPLDGPRNAKKFLEHVKPVLVVFIKYEFWFYYLKKIKYRQIPLLLVSAIFRKSDGFFKWHGSLQRKMLSRFDHFFVQDPHSASLLAEIGFSENVTVSGDTRFDRVSQIASGGAEVPLIRNFLGGSPCLVAGSTWPNDEKLLAEIFSDPLLNGFKLIIAPHEIDAGHIHDLQQAFPEVTTYSVFNPASPAGRIMIIDRIGLLSRLYRYGTYCYVGGGFNSAGTHNILEAAVYGKIVFFGTNHQKHREAVELVNRQAAVVVKEKNEFLEILARFNNDPELKSRLETSALEYVQSQKGATAKIIAVIQEKRLLTS